MKINLLLDNPNDILNGYVNIDPFSKTQNSIESDVSNLDEIVCNGEAEEILAYDIIDYFPPQILDSVLTNWLNKLKRGGTLTLATMDFDEVCRAYVQGLIDYQKVNIMLHGEQKKQWQLRKVSVSPIALTSVIQNKGYKILQKRFENFRYILTCQRPE